MKSKIHFRKIHFRKNSRFEIPELACGRHHFYSSWSIEKEKVTCLICKKFANKPRVDPDLTYFSRGYVQDAQASLVGDKLFPELKTDQSQKFIKR